MLPRKSRLTKGKDFKEVARKAKSIHSHLFLIKALFSPEVTTRFGIIVSTKVSKKATIRNRIKRQVREIIRRELPRVKNNYNVMIIVKDSIINKNFQELAKDLSNLLIKSHLLK